MKFMKQLLSLFGIATAVLLSSTAALAAPVNDAFVNATPIVGPIATVTGNNVGATKQFGGEPTFVGGDFGGASVWWTWTASASGQTTIDTMGSDFDTLLGVFTGTAANALTLIADNNNCTRLQVFPLKLLLSATRVKALAAVPVNTPSSV